VGARHGLCLSTAACCFRLCSLVTGEAANCRKFARLHGRDDRRLLHCNDRHLLNLVLVVLAGQHRVWLMRTWSLMPPPLLIMFLTGAFRLVQGIAASVGPQSHVAGDSITVPSADAAIWGRVRAVHCQPWSFESRLCPLCLLAFV
jgi:hypothetical protein